MGFYMLRVLIKSTFRKKKNQEVLSAKSQWLFVALTIWAIIEILTILWIQFKSSKGFGQNIIGPLCAHEEEGDKECFTFVKESLIYRLLCANVLFIGAVMVGVIHVNCCFLLFFALEK